jgi:Leucine-rich repeat (LRR) protein
VQPTLAASIPNLQTLVLTKNRMAELADLDPLALFKKLTYLSLMGNPVASKEVRTLCSRGNYGLILAKYT